jgi:hypothetical protein
MRSHEKSLILALVLLSYDPRGFGQYGGGPQQLSASPATPLTSKLRRMSSAGTASAALLTSREARNVFGKKHKCQATCYTGFVIYRGIGSESRRPFWALFLPLRDYFGLFEHLELP